MEKECGLSATLPRLLTWRLAAFGELSLLELQNIHRARQEVFVIEQHCVYADADLLDEHSHHLAAWSSDQALPWAYARIVAPGARYAEPAIGRVLTSVHARGRGLGHELMKRALHHATELYPGHPIRISAQAHLLAFYESLGFSSVGEIYLEDEIPHIEMIKYNMK